VAFQTFEQRSRFRDDDFGFNSLRSTLNENRLKYFSSLTSQQVSEVYFPHVDPVKSSDVEVFNDTENFLKKPTVQDDFRLDIDRSGVGDLDEPFAFNAKLYISNDGALLLEAWNSVKDQVRENEVLFFIENNEGDTFSEQVMLVAAGSGLSEYYGEESISEWINESIPITQEQVLNLFNQGISQKTLFEQLWVLVESTVAEARDFLLDKGIEAMKAITSFARETIYFQPNNYNNDAEDYSPSFLPYEQLKSGNLDPRTVFSNATSLPLAFAQLGIGASLDVSELVITQLEAKFQSIDSVLSDHLSPEKDNKLIPDFLERKVEQAYKTISTVTTTILSKLKAWVETLQELFDQYSVVFNGFLCGLVNGILDLIVGIFDLLQLALQGIKAGSAYKERSAYYNNLALEYFDNIVQVIAGVDWGAVIDQLIPVLQDGFKALQSFVGAKLEAMSAGTMAYYVGYIVWGVLEFFIPGGVIVKGARGALAGSKVSATILKILREVSEVTLGIKQKANAAANAAFSIFQEIAQSFVALLKKGADAIVKFFEDFIFELRKAALIAYGFSEEVIQLFDELGILLVKNLDDAIPAVAQTVDGQFVIIYNNTPIFAGAKDAIVQFSKRLDDLGDGAKKYLDELSDYPSEFVKKDGSIVKFSNETVEYFKSLGLKITDSPRGQQRTGFSLVEIDSGFIKQTLDTKGEILEYEKLLKTMAGKNAVRLLDETNKTIRKKPSAYKVKNNIPVSKKSKGAAGASPTFSGLNKYLKKFSYHPK